MIPCGQLGPVASRALDHDEVWSSRFRSFAYAASLIPAALAVLGNLLGGWWTLSTVCFLLALVIPDCFLKRRTPPGREGTIPRAVLFGQVLLQTTSLIVLLLQIQRGALYGDSLRCAVFSTGLAAGAGGIVAAHELIHRRARLFRFSGIWLLFLSHFTHYYIEHLQGHHRNVGCQVDPGTARFGENFYRYMARLVPGQFLVALRIEAQRLSQRHLPPYGFRNFVVSATVIEIAFAVTLGLAFSWTLSLAYLCVGAIARFFLESATYVQHYGLERKPGETVEPVHSWESNSILSRAVMLEIARHSDHHCHSSRPYSELASHPASLELPAGYFGLFPIVLIPPLWFALAHPRLLALSQPVR